jgi:hypothetical protein
MSHRPKLRKPCVDCRTPFLGTAPARFCPSCRWRHRGRKPKKYVWTPERDQVLRARYDGRVKGRAAAVAALFGWPRWVIVKRAAQLGLCYPANRKDWSDQETKFLMDHVGTRTTHWIAKQLVRSESSVVLKCKRLQISRRFKDGYTLRELELCFGIDHHGIDRWIRAGKLVGRRRGTRRVGNGGRPLGKGEGPADPWCFTDADLLRFITTWPMEFRLDKVDQLWFLDLLLAGGVVRKAIRESA